eukprot:PLAT12862.1.p1 GENE.PLAT12862.1~~PLAT12862.1.p1  ORF type:complete len:261 (+),score=57.50 PLAT12862.1:1-783(+)
MAGNYWDSTHRGWLERQRGRKGEPPRLNVGDEEAGILTAEDIRVLHISFAKWIQRMSRKKLPYRVIATAVVYFKRFYLKHCFSDFDPYLVGLTCIYLSSKVEEYSMTSENIIAWCKQSLRGVTDHPVLRFTDEDLQECEVFLLEALEFELVTFHPYRDALRYVEDAKMEADSVQTVWTVINDSYRTNVCLSRPPYIVALAAVYIAAVESGQDVTLWFEELHIDQKEVDAVVSCMLRLYETYPAKAAERAALDKLAGYVPA